MANDSRLLHDVHGAAQSAIMKLVHHTRITELSRLWGCSIKRSIFHLPTQRRTGMDTQTPTATAVRPFHVDIPDEAFTELRRRIAATRLPPKELVADASQGVQLA